VVAVSVFTESGNSFWLIVMSFAVSNWQMPGRDALSTERASSVN